MNNKRNFEIIDLEQGTDRWLAWRHEGIGASEASIIMDENPWKTSAELLAEKCGELGHPKENASMALGSALEPQARAQFISKTGISVEPACLQSRKFDWLKASVDGISKDLQTVVEIKCGRSVYKTTAQSRKPPSYYYGQLQHILAVTGLGGIDFFCHFPSEGADIHIKVARDDEYIERLLTTEAAFWKNVWKSRTA